MKHIHCAVPPETIYECWTRHELAEPDICMQRLVERVERDTGATMFQQIRALEEIGYFVP